VGAAPGTRWERHGTEVSALISNPPIRRLTSLIQGVRFGRQNMNLKVLAISSIVVGVLVAGFAGSAIARNAGFGAQSWLMMTFALGILIISQGPVFKLQHRVRELEKQLLAVVTRSNLFG
jgi:heme/copper-type cytochrome/quinol oxidase subunit 3